MNINLPYQPLHSTEWLESFFSQNFYKKPYDRFMWWRSYTTKTKPLSHRSTLKERILNGDFDASPFKFESEIVEHRLNEKYKALYKDTGRYVEETSLDRSRRKRLLQDYEKDEAKKLEELQKAFLLNFKITKEQYEEEIVNADLDLIDFYFYVEEKYGTYWKPSKIPKF